NFSWGSHPTPILVSSSSDKLPAALAAAPASLPCSPEKDTGHPDFSESWPSTQTRRNALPATFKDGV
ncbi:hypothetical protein EI555_017703, partial [Monodon monoceros]